MSENVNTNNVIEHIDGDMEDAFMDDDDDFDDDDLQVTMSYLSSFVI